MADRQSLRPGRSRSSATANAAKVALRDQLLTARHRRGLLEVGAAAPGHRRARAGDPGGTPGGHRGGVRLGRRRARHRPPCSTAWSRPGKRVIAAGACCRASTSTGRCTTGRRRWRPPARAARAGRSAARASRRSRPPTWCWCPGLAVSPTGLRLGQGGGCYDRALGRVPVGTPVWVLLYDDEVGLDVPAEPHDRSVTGCRHPRGLTLARWLSEGRRPRHDTDRVS